MAGRPETPDAAGRGPRWCDRPGGRAPSVTGHGRSCAGWATWSSPAAYARPGWWAPAMRADCPPTAQRECLAVV